MNMKDKLKSKINKGNPLILGRIKGKIEFNKFYNIQDFNIVKNKRSEEYSVFIVEGDLVHFYFGGSVITDKFKQILTELNEEELQELRKTGLPVKFIQKQSNYGRTYTSMIII